MDERTRVADQLTALFHRAIDTLFLANAMGTSMGILIGIVLNDAFSAFAVVRKGWVSEVRSVVHWWAFVGFSIVGINIRPYLRRHKLSPTIVEALEFIKRQERDKTVPRWQIRVMYQSLFTKVLENLVLEPGLEERLGSQPKPQQNASPPLRPQ